MCMTMDTSFVCVCVFRSRGKSSIILEVKPWDDETGKSKSCTHACIVHCHVLCVNWSVIQTCVRLKGS